MNVTPLQWNESTGWQPPVAAWPEQARLILYFGDTDVLARPAGPIQDLLAHFPTAIVTGCSTSGEIMAGQITDGTVRALCVDFATTTVRAEAVAVENPAKSMEVGRQLACRLVAEDLKHVLVLSDGLAVDGAALAKGLAAILPSSVQATGGLAGDGVRFGKTLIGLGANFAPKQVVAIGLYGAKLRSSFQLAGGWAAFGPYLEITEATNNRLLRIADEPALDVYRRYLGARAEGLPATGLSFPLQLVPDIDSDDGVMRSILGIDEKELSLQLAGTVQKGHYVRISRAGTDELIERCSEAAPLAPSQANGKNCLALLVSCVGRRLVMGDRTTEEIEAIARHFGDNVATIGFYSYGELGPVNRNCRCALHNQTMTISLLHEAA